MVAAQTDPTNPWIALSSYGPIGMLLGYLLYRWGKGQIGDNSERDRLRVAVDKVMDQMVPAMLEANRLTKEVADTVVPAVRELRDVVRDLEREVNRLRDRGG